jgi:hypothetical protein
VGAAAQLRRGLGEDRVTGRPRELRCRAGESGIGLAAGEDQAARRRRDPRRELVQQSRLGVRSSGRDRREGRLAAPVERQRRGRGDIALDRHRRQRLAPGEVEVDRPGPGLAAGGGVGTARGGAHVEEARVVGFVGADLAEPADRIAVELQLIDRLTGANRAQLGGAVGSEDEQGHSSLVGLGDSRMQIGRRRARGA